VPITEQEINLAVVPFPDFSHRGGGGHEPTLTLQLTLS